MAITDDLRVEAQESISQFSNSYELGNLFAIDTLSCPRKSPPYHHHPHTNSGSTISYHVPVSYGRHQISREIAFATTTVQTVQEIELHCFVLLFFFVCLYFFCSVLVPWNNICLIVLESFCPIKAQQFSAFLGNWSLIPVTRHDSFFLSLSLTFDGMALTCEKSQFCFTQAL